MPLKPFTTSFMCLGIFCCIEKISCIFPQTQPLTRPIYSLILNTPPIVYFTLRVCLSSLQSGKSKYRFLINQFLIKKSLFEYWLNNKQSTYLVIQWWYTIGMMSALYTISSTLLNSLFLSRSFSQINASMSECSL